MHNIGLNKSCVCIVDYSLTQLPIRVSVAIGQVVVLYCTV